MGKNDWTNEELQILKEEYKKGTNPIDISKLLGRSVNGVKMKASRLKISKQVNKTSKPHKDLTGIKFGRLRAIKPLYKNIYNSIIWSCECECDGKIVEVSEYNLLNGHTKSCGCISVDNCKKNFKKYNTYDLSKDYGVGYTDKNEIFYFDKEDYHLIKDYCWRISTCGYVQTVDPVDGKVKMIHRIILGMYDDEQYENSDVDHIDGNTIDNRKSNLRIVTRSQNNMNRKLQSNNTSGITGVVFNNQNNKWHAQIGLNHKTIHLGNYSSFEEAKQKRKEAEQEYFNEYAYDNSRGINDNENK